ncbi:MAG: dTMP kinase [Ignavibacteria bacterium]|nr:dTMP kinase [Ignavibacteria bacterium]
MFITFEGIDLSGKSTQATLLYKHLKKKGKKVILVREPGGTAISEKIRKILLDKKNKNMYPITEFFLFSASRYQLTKEVIKPYLKKGYIVICDRYYDSSTAYQGYGGFVDLKHINSINRIASENLEPHITFLVDIPIEESVRRRKIANKVNDRFESKKLSYYKKIISGYRKLSKLNKHRIFTINGCNPINEIHKHILKILEKYNI